MTFERVVHPFVVIGDDGEPLDLPFLGGLDVPRPQFVDIDGDGDPDLFLQEYANTLWFFENVGTSEAPRFEWRTDRFQDLEIGEWYRFVDVNGDGQVDLLTESPVSRIRYYRNTGTKTKAAFAEAGRLRDGAGEAMFMDRQNIPAFGDLDCDGRLDILVGRVEGVVDRYEAAAPNAEAFDLIEERYEGIEIIGTIGGGGGGFGMPSLRHGANALALADFDGDGDLDLFWGDFFEPAVLLIENIGRTCSSPSFQVDPVVLPFADDVRSSGYNTPAPVDLNGDGRLDFLMGVIGGAFNPIKTSRDNFIFWERVAPGRFEQRTRRFLDALDLGADAAPALADIDADGDLDLVVGSKIDPSAGFPSLYLFRNVGTRTAPRFGAPEAIRLADAYHLAPALGDLDADGDLDMILGTWNQDLLYYRNEGTPREPRWVQDAAMTIVPPRATHSMPVLADADADGDLDLLIGQANGAVLFYRNTGTTKAPVFTLDPGPVEGVRAGRRSAPFVIDVDGDGLLDLVVGQENTGPLAVYRNAGTRAAPRFVPHTPLAIPQPPVAVPFFADIDGDGAPDLFVGTTSGGVRFYRGRR